MKYKWTAICVVFLSLFTAFPSIADKVTPSERVTNSLTIRADSNGSSERIGQLLKGEQAKLLGEQGHYYHIRTTNGLQGYVAKSYSTIIPETEKLTIVTWNLEGPGGLENKALKQFAAFAGDADVIVLEETLGLEQTTQALEVSELVHGNVAVSDFAKDSEPQPYLKQELAIVSLHPYSKIVEVDPYPSNDSAEARQLDLDFEIPEWIPEGQTRKGARGWLWVEIPSLKLVVAAVHLKSSQGATGHKDKGNSDKREVVAAGLVEAIIADTKARDGWSYVVAGDFNVAPGDIAKVGIDLKKECTESECLAYDQTHAIFGGGLVEGFVMRNLVEGLSSSYAKGNFTQSPIDNIYAVGPIFDQVTKLIVERGAHFGSDHYAIKVQLEY